jgi:hypothetical protein
MKIFTLLICIFLGSQTAFAVTVDEAKAVASAYLQAEVNLDQQSLRSYFFITGSEGAGDFPCIRGVLVSQESGQVVAPTSDQEINIYFPYSDTRIENLVVVNCAD